MHQRHPNKLILPLCLFMLAILVTAGAKTVQASGEITDPAVEYTFGGQATFRARLTGSSTPREVLVSFRSSGETETIIGEADVNEDGELVYVHDLSDQPLRAFTTVDYWFTLTEPDGTVATSPTFSFQYIDNRFNWQTLEDGLFRVHWYDGDIAFGQEIADVAASGLEHARSLLPLPDPDAVEIYVYTRAADYSSTLQLSGQNWMAGNAVVDQHLMAVSLLSGPEQRLDMERKIPHELMHILVYQLLGNGYRRLPVWLSEGLATMAELYPNPQYHSIMQSALKTDQLIPITDLCPAFPVDASGVYLAYAESSSFSRYIYRQFGSTRLQELIGRYADGVECERGAELVLGQPLSEIEKAWLKDFNPAAAEQIQVTETEISADALPWFVLLFIALVAPLALATVGGKSRQSVHQDVRSRSEQAG